MSTNKFKIRFQSVNDTMDQFKNDWKAIEKGSRPSKLVAGTTPCLIMEYAMFAKIFSPERLRIIDTIQSRHPASVSELADLLGREQANVHRDVHYLAELGILELKRVKEEGKAEVVQPEFNWNGFDIEMGNSSNEDKAA